MATLDARARRYERQDRQQWEEERAQLLEKIRKQAADAKRLAKRFKLMEQTLKEQQGVISRYRKALLATGSALPPAEPHTVRDDCTVRDNVCVEDASSAVKRSRTSPDERATAKRHSMSSVEQHANANADRQPSSHRRKSLPGKKDQPPVVHNEVRRAGPPDSWLSRKRDMEGGGPRTICATEILRPRAAILAANPPPPTWKGDVKREHDHLHDSIDSFLDELEPTSKTIKSDAEVDQRGALTGTSTRLTRPPSPASSQRHSYGNGKTRAQMPPRSANEPAFPYVEVVRNREERAALPAYDCVECRKYYEALDGLVSESEIKAKCSRHRARFEPYQTPDDFWRLSFPDSHSDEMASP